jgi:hypothetical protein
MQDLRWSTNECIDPNCEGFYFQEVPRTGKREGG